MDLGRAEAGGQVEDRSRVDDHALIGLEPDRALQVDDPELVAGEGGARRGPPAPSKFSKCSSQTTPSLWKQVNWPGGLEALMGLVHGVPVESPRRASAEESTPSSVPASVAEGTWPSLASLTSRPSRLLGFTCLEPTLLDPSFPAA